MTKKQLKKWQVAPTVDKKFQEKFSDYPLLLTQILWNRGLRKKTEIKYFLEASYGQDAFDPWLFNDMKSAVDLLIKHIKQKNKITVYGDYDADGVSSSVLLLDTLKILQAQIDFYIPDRTTEGYGLNKKALKKIINQGTKLIITVDTGIRNQTEVEFIKEQGVDIIITDHHIPGSDKNDLPKCLIINPILTTDKYPFKKLAGVGVALKFAQALISKTTLDESTKNKLQNKLFDLSSIGTIADCVSLRGENRLIVKEGLKKLSQTKRLGLIELMKIAQIKNIDNLDSWNIGFQLAPRINAAGRMDHANTAFALLNSKNKDEAVELAKELNFNNQKRQKSTEAIIDNVEAQLVEQKKDFLLTATYKYKPGEEKKPWNEGIIGLVAGRITEKYYRPSLVITETADGYKGSGRSIAEFNITEALEKSSKYLLRYGGHPMACGFSLKKDKLESFLQAMKKIAQEKLNNLELIPTIKIDAVIDLEKINIDLVESLNVLKPYGQDNPEPIFLSKNIQILDKLNMGATNQHVKFKLKNNFSAMVSAIGFSQAEQWQAIKPGDLIDMVYNISINEFNGHREAQLKIIDMKINQKQKKYENKI